MSEQEFKENILAISRRQHLGHLDCLQAGRLYQELSAEYFQSA
jgi:hypothetical protein